MPYNSKHFRNTHQISLGTGKVLLCCVVPLTVTPIYCLKELCWYKTDKDSLCVALDPDSAQPHPVPVVEETTGNNF